MKSLRKKNYMTTKHHTVTNWQSICQKKAESPLDASFLGAKLEQLSTTEKVFRTAYYIAKSNRSFTDHPGLLDLQIISGLNMGRVLHSNVLCTDIVHFTAEDMKKIPDGEYQVYKAQGVYSD